MGGKKSKNRNFILTIAAIFVGAFLGLVFGEKMAAFKFIGSSWLNCIKMMMVPLVFCVMALAVGSQSNAKFLGRIALRMMIYFVCTTALAVVVGITAATLIKPGLGISLEGYDSAEIASSAFSFTAFAESLFSGNIFDAFAKGNMMQTMVISIFVGAAILAIRDQEKKDMIIRGLEACREVIYKYIGFIIEAAPVGVLFLVADAFGQYGWAILGSMMKLVVTYWIGVTAQILLVYCTFIWITARINPIRFLKETVSVWTFTIATCSSVANIPVSIKCATEKFNVPECIANFCVPLGAQVNFDGAALMHGAVLVFISQLYGLDFTLAILVKSVVVATVISSCGGGIPGSNIVKMMIVVETLGLPTEVVGIIAGFYRLFDMAATTGNCLGDLVGTVGVTKMEERRACRKNLKPEWEE